MRSLGSDTDDSVIYEASKVGTNFLKNFATAVGEWMSFAMCLCSFLFFVFITFLLSRSGQTVGKFLSGIVIIDKKYETPKTSILFRCLISIPLLPISAIQLLLLQSDETLLDSFTQTNVVSSFDNGDDNQSWTDVKPVKPVQLPKNMPKTKIKQTTKSKNTPLKKRSSTKLSTSAMSSFTEREFQDVLVVAVYVAFTAYLFHDRSFTIPPIPSGYGWHFGLFVNTYNFITGNPFDCAKVVVVTMGVCIGWVLVGKIILRPTIIYYVVLSIPLFISFAYLSEVFMSGSVGLFNTSYHSHDIFSQVMQYMMEMGWQLFLVALSVAYFRSKAQSVRLSAAVVNESFGCAAANVIMILIVPCIEGLFQVYQLWLIVQTQVTNDETMRNLQYIHLLWTLFSLRCMTQIIFSNCVGKWYFAESDPGKFSLISRPLDAAFAGMTKQLGSAFFAGAIMMLVYCLNKLANAVQKKCDQMNWYNLATLPIKIVLWICAMVLSALTYYLSRLVDAGCAWCGITGVNFWSSAMYGKTFADSNTDLLLMNGAMIDVLICYLSVPMIAGSFLAVTAVLQLNPSGSAPNVVGNTMYTSGEEDYFSQYFVSFYLVASFTWFLKMCTDSVLICVLEDDSYASSMVRDALKNYKNAAHWKFWQGCLRITIVIACAFAFEQVAKQGHSSFVDLGSSDDMLLRVGRVVLHAAGILWASSA